MNLHRITQKFISFILVLAFLFVSIIPGNAITENGNELPKSNIDTLIQSLKSDNVSTSTDLNVEKNILKNPTKRLLVKYKDESISDKTNTCIEKKLGKKLSRKKQFKKLKVNLIEIDELSQSNTIEELKKIDNVDIVQPDYPLTLNYVPKDEMYPKQWGLKNTCQVVRGNEGVLGVDVNAEAAWDETTGTKDVIVAVLDTGIDINHYDLSENIYKNTKEIANDGIDNDGNGKIDDVNGWDFANDDNSVFDNATEDEHGTHVAGIIAAGMNQKGTVGVAPNITILPLKFIKNGVGYTSDALEAIEYAQKCGAGIVNCSWGGTEYNAILEDAMKNSQMLFVCAAGNNNTDISTAPVYPASFKLDNLVSVTACNNTGKLAWYANFGKGIDIAAPGVEIVSTVPNNTYKSLNGTSMSAGFVSGAAALISSKYPDTSANALKSRIIDYAQQTEYLSGAVYNNGLLDAFGALTENKTDRIAETGVIVTNDNKDTPECPQKNNEPLNKKNALPFDMTVKKANSNKVTINISLLDDKYSTCEIFIFSPDKKIPLFHQTQISSYDKFEIKDYRFEIPYSFEVRLKSGNDIISYCGKFSFYTKSSKKDIVLAFNGVYKNSTYELFTENLSMADGEVNPLSSYMEVEPNNSSTQVNSIPFSGVDDVVGYISSTADEDWYTVQCNSAGKMNFWLGNIPSGCDYDLKVYKRAENGAFIEFGSSTKGSNASELIEQKPVNQNETYFIKVYSASGYSGSSQYKLAIHNYVTVTDDYCNEMQNARLFYTGGDVYGKIDYAGDVDWLTFVAQRSGNFTIESMGSTDVVGELFNMGGTSIAYNDDISTADRNFRIKADLIANQTYYIKIKHVYTTATGDYSIRVSQTEMAPALSISDITSTSFKLNAVYPYSGQYGNGLYIYDTSTGSWIDVYGSWYAKDGSYTVNNLKPGVKYSCYLYWYTDSTSPWLQRNQNIEITTLANTASVNATDVTCDSLTINAVYPVSGQSRNKLLVYECDGSSNIAVYSSANTGDGSYTVSGLKPLTKYKIEMEWVNYNQVPLIPYKKSCEVTTSKAEWYLIEDSGKQIYLSDIGAQEDNTTGVIAKVVEGNYLSTYALNTSGTSTWALNSTVAYTPGSDIGLCSTDGSIVTPNLFGIKNVFKIDTDGLKNKIRDKIFSAIGVVVDDFEPDDITYFLDGIKASIDDNISFGLLNKLGLTSIAWDEYFFVAGKTITDAAFLYYFTFLTGASGGASAYLFAQAEVTAVVGVIALAGGVTIPVGVVVEVGSVGSLVGGAGCAVVSFVAAKAASKANNILQASKVARSNLPNYNSGNFRSNLSARTGGVPSNMTKPQAHHMFPQKFRNFFNRFRNQGLDLHNPQYGSWVESSKHLSEAYNFNKDWESWIAKTANPTVQMILDKGRELAIKYGYTIHF